MSMFKRKVTNPAPNGAVSVEPSGARAVDLYKALTSHNGRRVLDGIADLSRDAERLKGFQPIAGKQNGKSLLQSFN